mmetsp:Transcript_2303/g.8909  ORF Transcript_2303/g.8909 Transcript_2303/m.8909 type:complete len:112 (-) Transcript_2303:94-429(-)
MGGAQITSTSAVISPAFKSFTSFAIDLEFPLHFQFPPTTNLPVPAMATTEREPAPALAETGDNESATVARTFDGLVNRAGPETLRAPACLGLAATRAVKAWCAETTDMAIA